MPNYDEEALVYHREPRPGKLEVVPTKPTATQHDLSLAYSPGVAAPCLEIEKDPALAYEYTNKGNLVAVVSNGSAVLGLGNIGALAGKPVMEGKAVLFKRFAFVDVFDIEVQTKTADEFIAAVKALEPTFGGINLEDIGAPDCFYIEETLEREMDIPVFHDDQHGTAIIAGAALLNACEIVGKELGELQVVVNGAGAAGIACSTMLVTLGVKKENMLVCDSRGVIYEGRGKGLNPYKERFMRQTDRRTLADAMKGADAFLGLSVKGAVTQDMVRSMARDPIVFAMANPDPEITYAEVKEARADAIAATGRSDFPNQVNNVLGFPFLFRGALDTRSRYINPEMKMAAVRSLASLAKKDVPDSVSKAYGGSSFRFGREYLIPKPFDPRVLYHMATEVARAAMESGSARVQIDLAAYREQLKRRIDPTRSVVSIAVREAVKERQRIVFPEATEAKVLKAAATVASHALATPVLLGEREAIERAAREAHVRLEGVEILDPATHESGGRLRAWLLERGEDVGRDGSVPLDPFLAGIAAVEMGVADGMVGGIGREYGAAIRPTLRLAAKAEGVQRAAGIHILFLPARTLFFADTALNVDPDSDALCEITALTARFVRQFDVEPIVALTSFTNLGENPHPVASRVAYAVSKIRGRLPSLKVMGEMQVSVALDPAAFPEIVPSSRHYGPANTLIFPNLDAANASFRLIRSLMKAEVLGPFIVGLKKSINILPRDSTEQDLVGTTAITAMLARGA
ncbi:MAG: NADP-dependent malic enzyme [Planctomycetota bacterium]|jgi:malate dehydrogenase (oxaloacetate-decarboxylating)(NADP+)